MSTSKEPVAKSKWAEVISLLRCNVCHGPLHFESPEELSCPGCPRKLKIENGILHLTTEFEGNNAIAAKYYNSPLWPKFRFWEWVSLYLPRGGEKNARNEVLGNLPNLSGTRLLDVAMGDGRNLPLIPRDCQVFGVDISRVLLEKAQRDFPEWDTHLIVGEAEALPFPDRTFDNLFSLGALNHVNNPGLALQEMARVVQPGGQSSSPTKCPTCRTGKSLTNSG
jgi:2-polyprenyl-3-methyl-5-hydroxy-6-metoxy-1,4-benzoquinol methylase